LDGGGVAGEAHHHTTLSTIEPGGGAGLRLRRCLLNKQVDGNVFYKVGKSCADKFIGKAPNASLFADMLCEGGATSQCGGCKLLANTQIGRRNAD
jgi:hypothetical protein